VIRTAGQKGTFIHSEAASFVEQHNQTDALLLMRELVARLREQGMSNKQIQAAFKAAITQ
jgi:DNA-binding transcriptional regulator YhcF (GntR family)